MSCTSARSRWSSLRAWIAWFDSSRGANVQSAFECFLDMSIFVFGGSGRWCCCEHAGLSLGIWRILTCQYTEFGNWRNRTSKVDEAFYWHDFGEFMIGSKGIHEMHVAAYHHMKLKWDLIAIWLFCMILQYVRIWKILLSLLSLLSLVLPMSRTSLQLSWIGPLLVMRGVALCWLSWFLEWGANMLLTKLDFSRFLVRSFSLFRCCQVEKTISFIEDSCATHRCWPSG